MKKTNTSGQFLFRTFCSFLVFTFANTSIMPVSVSFAQEPLTLPKPGVMVALSPQFTPAHLQGITIHQDNALRFDFLVHKGDQPMADNEKKEEYNKLIKYFLASLTISDKDQWVNLSPYEKDRIIEGNFGKTEMGRDLLGQDYLLKQITASLIYPEKGLGQTFWDKVYERAFKEYGTTNIPVNTFNKVWIIPDQAAVYESGNTVYVLRNHLKVMLEEDYLAIEKNRMPTRGHVPEGAVSPSMLPSKESVEGESTPGKSAIAAPVTNTIGSQIIREIVLPALEKEVNEGKNFAQLRQIYSGMILATWYKHALKDSLLGKVYADKDKVKGVDQDPKANEDIYQQYLQAFKKGVFNYIKEDDDKYTQERIPRKYFSGGVRKLTATTDDVSHYDEAAVVVVTNETLPRAAAIMDAVDYASLAKAPIDRAIADFSPEQDNRKLANPDAAMTARELARRAGSVVLRTLVSLSLGGLSIGAALQLKRPDSILNYYHNRSWMAISVILMGTALWTGLGIFIKKDKAMTSETAEVKPDAAMQVSLEKGTLVEIPFLEYQDHPVRKTWPLAIVESIVNRGGNNIYGIRILDGPSKGSLFEMHESSFFKHSLSHEGVGEIITNDFKMAKSHPRKGEKRVRIIEVYQGGGFKVSIAYPANPKVGLTPPPFEIFIAPNREMLDFIIKDSEYRSVIDKILHYMTKDGIPQDKEDWTAILKRIYVRYGASVAKVMTTTELSSAFGRALGSSQSLKRGNSTGRFAQSIEKKTREVGEALLGSIRTALQNDFQKYPAAGRLLEALKVYDIDSLSSIPKSKRSEVDGLISQLSREVNADKAMTADDVNSLIKSLRPWMSQIKINEITAMPGITEKITALTALLPPSSTPDLGARWDAINNIIIQIKRKSLEENAATVGLVKDLTERIQKDILHPVDIQIDQLKILGAWYSTHPVPDTVIAFLAVTTTWGNVIPDATFNAAIDALVQIYISLNITERIRMTTYLTGLASGVLQPPDLSWFTGPMGYFYILSERFRLFRQRAGNNTTISDTAMTSKEVKPDAAMTVIILQANDSPLLFELDSFDSLNIFVNGRRVETIRKSDQDLFLTQKNANLGHLEPYSEGFTLDLEGETLKITKTGKDDITVHRYFGPKSSDSGGKRVEAEDALEKLDRQNPTPPVAAGRDNPRRFAPTPRKPGSTPDAAMRAGALGKVVRAVESLSAFPEKERFLTLIRKGKNVDKIYQHLVGLVTHLATIWDVEEKEIENIQHVMVELFPLTTPGPPGLIENTVATMLANYNPLRGHPDVIVEEEMAGQRQLIQSEDLPTKGTVGKEHLFAALGVQLGGPLQDDPLFRRAVFPKGWKLVAGYDATDTRLVDADGRIRARIFYKNAIHDRSADISLEDVDSNSEAIRAVRALYFVQHAAVAGMFGVIKAESKEIIDYMSGLIDHTANLDRLYFLVNIFDAIDLIKARTEAPFAPEQIEAFKEKAYLKAKTFEPTLSRGGTLKKSQFDQMVAVRQSNVQIHGGAVGAGGLHVSYISEANNAFALRVIDDAIASGKVIEIPSVEDTLNAFSPDSTSTGDPNTGITMNDREQLQIYYNLVSVQWHPGVVLKGLFKGEAVYLTGFEDAEDLFNRLSDVKFRTLPEIEKIVGEYPKGAKSERIYKTIRKSKFYGLGSEGKTVLDQLIKGGFLEEKSPTEVDVKTDVTLDRRRLKEFDAITKPSPYPGQVDYDYSDQVWDIFAQSSISLMTIYHALDLYQGNPKAAALKIEVGNLMGYPFAEKTNGQAERAEDEAMTAKQARADTAMVSRNLVLNAQKIYGQYDGDAGEIVALISGQDLKEAREYVASFHYKETAILATVFGGGEEGRQRAKEAEDLRGYDDEGRIKVIGRLLVGAQERGIAEAIYSTAKDPLPRGIRLSGDADRKKTDILTYIAAALQNNVRAKTKGISQEHVLETVALGKGVEQFLRQNSGLESIQDYDSGELITKTLEAPEAPVAYVQAKIAERQEGRRPMIFAFVKGGDYRYVFKWSTDVAMSARDLSGRRDEALLNPGGIDMNSANMDLQIKRDGKGVPLPLQFQDMEKLRNIQGFVPVIIQIVPVVSLPFLSELREQVKPTALAKAA